MISLPLFFDCALPRTGSAGSLAGKTGTGGCSSFGEIFGTAMRANGKNSKLELPDGKPVRSLKNVKWAVVEDNRSDEPGLTDEKGKKVIDALAGLIGVEPAQLEKLLQNSGLTPGGMYNSESIEQASAEIVRAFGLSREIQEDMALLMRLLARQVGISPKGENEALPSAEELSAAESNAANLPDSAQSRVNTGSPDIAESPDNAVSADIAGKADFAGSADITGGNVTRLTQNEGSEEARIASEMPGSRINKTNPQNAEQEFTAPDAIPERPENLLLLIEKLAGKIKTEIRKSDDSGKSTNSAEIVSLENELNTGIKEADSKTPDAESNTKVVRLKASQDDMTHDEGIRNSLSKEGEGISESVTRCDISDASLARDSFNLVGSTRESGQPAKAAKLYENLEELCRDITSQVAGRAKVVLSDGKSSMEIKLKPENLGRLILEIIEEQGAITAKIIADSHQVKQLLEANMPALKDAFEKQGLNVQMFDVSVRQDFNGRQERFGQGAKKAWGASRVKTASGYTSYEAIEGIDRLMSINPYLADESTINLTA
jgi:flagellar hook-length control protein FliK